MQCRSECPSSSLLRPRSLVDLLCQRASATGDKRVFTFLRPDGVEDESLTYHSLRQRAMAVAAELQDHTRPGERAVLLFPPGLDFIAAFFGCMYAGVIAVPAPIPNRNRLTTAVGAIFQAARPTLVLSTANHAEQARRTYANQLALSKCPWIAVDEISTGRQGDWRDPRVEGPQVAFLQYTSGSTSQPKGVMLSHDNLLYNAKLVQEAFNTSPESHAVFWLPLYHDMGLIGGVIQPVFCGGSATLMAPAAFLQRPALWLETISRTKASISGGPDFAYDLCARKVPSDALSQPDLSSWNLAFVGAERIRPQTIDHFVSRFASCGFRREAFFPCYGLAEATLIVSGGPHRDPPLVLNVHADALAQNRVRIGREQDPSCRSLVGCGENLLGQRIVVVDPHTHASLPEGHVGEIWVHGPSVADGYFENAQATSATFRARLADSSDGHFLRTGDLGFMHQNQLFVTGRLKNLIIIRGRNHYPEDIEQTIHSAHAGLRSGHCAAFSIEVDGQRTIGGRSGSRTAVPARGDGARHCRGNSIDPLGDCQPARVGSSCRCLGQSGGSSADFQWQDAACGVPRTVPARRVGNRGCVEGSDGRSGRWSRGDQLRQRAPAGIGCGNRVVAGGEHYRSLAVSARRCPRHDTFFGARHELA